ncbi:Tetratricopeptide repeat protein [Rosistilla carotiformis]|uniref:Tetratricopeptide repeat protein n=1 Tax=Rosistilla carotiformis TaxID=2528017 RepID=A0A518K0W3_9BACT|nr:tetratricopeptide repeat protein [Rosistilla carotiformis]QDV71430.1 Tetratricopeptide repeat protein [Rosistilla carotiformis]
MKRTTSHRRSALTASSGKQPASETRKVRASKSDPPRGVSFSMRTCIALTAAAVVLAFANSFYGVFLFDDQPNIHENMSLRSLQATWEASGTDVPSGLWNRPVGRWSLAVNYWISGLEPWSYHAVNLAIHLVASLILLDLLRRTMHLRGTPLWIREHANPIALVVTLVWAVHPLQTESVTYIVQRLESLMGMFYLATIYCLLRGARSRRHWWWYAAAVASCWLGAFTKEVMVTAPVVALLYDRIFLSRSWLTVLRRRGWVHAMTLPSSIYLVWAARRLPLLPRPASRPSIPSPFSDYTDPWNYLLSQPGVLLHYLQLTFWPRGQCLDYMWPVADSWPEIVLPGLVIIVLLTASFVALWRWPRLGFVGLASFLVLAPTSTIIPLRLAFEHRMYLSLAGVSLLTVLAAGWAIRRSIDDPTQQRRVAIGLSTIVLLSLIVTTHLRNTVYYSRLAMFQDNVAKAPENIFAYMNLGDYYLEVDDPASALPLFQVTTKIKPEDARTWTCVGCALKELGKLDQAAAMLKRAVELNPDYSQANHHYAVALEQLDDWPAAVEHFEKAIAQDPGNATIHNDVAVALGSRGLFADAEGYLRQALLLNPEHGEAHTNLGSMIMSQGGSPREAEFHFREAVRLQPDSREAALNLQRVQQLAAPAAVGDRKQKG